MADYASGFGGKHGIQKDRQDKTAVGFEYHADLAVHESQKGRVFWSFCPRNVVHRDDKILSQMRKFSSDSSLKMFPDYSKGFGGKYGLESDRKDKSAAGYEEHENVAPHESQTGK